MILLSVFCFIGISFLLIAFWLNKKINQINSFNFNMKKNDKKIVYIICFVGFFSVITGLLFLIKDINIWIPILVFIISLIIAMGFISRIIKKIT